MIKRFFRTIKLCWKSMKDVDQLKLENSQLKSNYASLYRDYDLSMKRCMQLEAHIKEVNNCRLKGAKCEQVNPKTRITNPKEPLKVFIDDRGVDRILSKEYYKG